MQGSYPLPNLYTQFGAEAMKIWHTNIWAKLEKLIFLFKNGMEYGENIHLVSKEN